MSRRLTVVSLLGLLGLTVAACASPAQRFSAWANDRGLRAAIVEGAGFEHVVFWPRAPVSATTLHVYLDGDGSPWIGGTPASDPTPRRTLVLDLMRLDPRPSVYVGRPCYHGTAERPPCHAALWTRDRYSERVVASMASAVRRIMEAGAVERVVWIGYSGGGTLAMLLAPRFSASAAIVTVAANLDIDAWADLHGYQRLEGSLNPARRQGPPPPVPQRHYAGGADDVVPPAIVARGPIAPGSLRIIPRFDHRCCWVTLWPEILAELTGHALPWEKPAI